MRMRARSGRQLAGQIDGDGPRQTGGKSHVVDHALPGAVRHLGLNVRRNRLQPRLPRGVHRGRAEVLDESVQEKPQWILRRPCAQIERQRMHVGKAGEGKIGEVLNILMIAERVPQQREHIAAMVVPRARGRVRRRCEHGSARGERRIVEESLVGIDVGPTRMIDRDQPKLIDKIDLFHGLAEAHAEIAIARFELRAVNLDPLVGIGCVLRRRRNPMADDPRADHVRDEFVLFPVPNEQAWGMSCRDDRSR